MPYLIHLKKELVVKSFQSYQVFFHGVILPFNKKTCHLQNKFKNDKYRQYALNNTKIKDSIL